MTAPKDARDDPALASANTIRTDLGPLDLTVPAPSGSGPGGLLGRRYQILAELGRGGEGAVYKVRDRHADEIVALKVLDNVREGSEELARLRRELANARRITHPGIVRLHDLVEVDERWALSMQLVEGESLEARITKGPLYGAGELVELTRRLAEALAAAHAAGVTHRDLKPANVLLHPDGRPVISDSGISRAHKARERRTSVSGERGPLMQTQTGTIVGTPLYMAPEQLLGESATPAVDVYALGLIVHEAATGTVPLVADTVPELLEVRTRGEAPSLGALRPDVPTRFVATIDRCLARDPASRFRDGAELLEALLAAAATREPPPASRPPVAPRGRVLAAWIIGAITVTVPLSVVVTRALSARSAVGPGVASASASVGPGQPSVVAPSAPSLQLSPRGHRRITFSPGCEEFPTFLPDGKRVVFDGSVGEKSHLYVLDVETGAQDQVTTSPGWDFAATASPVADEVAFLRYDLERRASYRLDLATKEVTLTRGLRRRRASERQARRALRSGRDAKALDHRPSRTRAAAAGAVHRQARAGRGRAGRSDTRDRDFDRPGAHERRASALGVAAARPLSPPFGLTRRAAPRRPTKRGRGHRRGPRDRARGARPQEGRRPARAPVLRCVRPALCRARALGRRPVDGRSRRLKR
ncbi:MAG: protein kinase [Myxococcales bacterium]|nr:protein kinase [Myxococcales bacterium]